MSWRGLSNDFTTRLRSNMKSLPKPLASKGEWTAFLDEETTGLIYYFNSKTGESVWEAPTSSFPEIKLTSDKKNIMDNKRREYQVEQGVEYEPEAKKGATGVFGNFFGDPRKSRRWS